MEYRFKYGAGEFIATGDDLKDLCKEVSMVTELPRQCDCGSTNIIPNMHSYDGNDYYHLNCLDCTSQFQLGQTKDGKKLFPKWDKGWTIWSKDGEKKPKTAQKKSKEVKANEVFGTQEEAPF